VRWEWRDWSLAGLKDIEPYEVIQTLTTGRTVRTWLTEHVLGVLGSTTAGRVLLVALYEDTEAWVVIGARPATPAEVSTYRRATDGRSS
jgi:hypothetical protein